MYFDTRNFHANSEHYYAKLRPEATGDLLALAEGEGEGVNAEWDNLSLVPQAN